MKNIFFLKHNVGYETLKCSINHKLTIDLVVINDQNKKEDWFKNIISICKRNKLSLHITHNINRDKKFLSKIKNFKSMLGISVYYTEIFTKIFLTYFDYGIINIHQSLLPKYRGLMPVQWAIISGENYTGLTAHFVNEKIDLGKIILKKKIKITNLDTALSVSNKLKKATPKLVLKVYKLFYSKNFKKIKLKKIEESPYLQRRNLRIDRINTNATLKKIHDFIRGLSFITPYAWLYFKKKKIFIKNSNFIKISKKKAYKNGINYNKNRIIIKKSNQILELKNFYIIKNNEKKKLILKNE